MGDSVSACAMNSSAPRTAARSAGPPRQTRTASGGAPSVMNASLATTPMPVERTWATNADQTIIDRFVVDPCPAQDFNGADFLYFASYSAFVDRAEWAFFRPRAPFATTRRRDIVYRGNIDPGERVVVTLLQSRRESECLAHWYRLAREQDGTTIGEVFTVRGLSGPG